MRTFWAKFIAQATLALNSKCVTCQNILYLSGVRKLIRSHTHTKVVPVRRKVWEILKALWIIKNDDDDKSCQRVEQADNNKNRRQDNFDGRGGREIE